MAVSGGPDSTCLLHLLLEAGAQYPLSLHAVHLNHLLRGREAGEDEEFVGETARRWGVPVTLIRRDVAAEARKIRKTIMETARVVRYQVLEEVRISHGGEWIVTGHQADDQAETLLMRMIRGAGTEGFSGIPAIRGRIIRPLLGFSKKAVREYLTERGISWREDGGNLKPDYFRNRLRENILPLLREENPAILEALSREADIFHEDHLALEEWTGRAVRETVEFPGPGSAVLRISLFTRLPLSVQRRVVRRVVLSLKGNIQNVSFDHVKSVLHFVSSGQTGTMLQLPGGLAVSRGYGVLQFRMGVSAPGRPPFEICLPLPGEIEVPGGGRKVLAEVVEGAAAGEESAAVSYFDLEKTGGILTVRSRRPGDIIYPAGLKGHRKKLQDLFVDRKVPRLERDGMILLAAPGRVLWAPGFERDFQSRVSPSTRKTLKVMIQSWPPDGN